MTELRLSYVNVEHGGRIDAGYSSYSGDGGPYDYSKVTGMFHDGDWPDIAVIGEGDRYELNGMEGAYEAAAALRDAGGPAYVPHPCSLPREWGMFAPVIYVDPTKVVVRRFYSHRLPDFASRNRNLMLFTLPGRADPIRIAVSHGDIYSGDTRLADNRQFDRLADPAIPCALLADWNTVPSGPHFEPADMNKPGVHNPRGINYRVQFQGGPRQAGPHIYDTRALDALDALDGWWNPDTHQREGGVGFHHAAELAGDFTRRRSSAPTDANAWRSTPSSSTTRSRRRWCRAPTASTTSATLSTPTPTTNASRSQSTSSLSGRRPPTRRARPSWMDSSPPSGSVPTSPTDSGQRRPECVPATFRNRARHALQGWPESPQALLLREGAASALGHIPSCRHGEIYHLSDGTPPMGSQERSLDPLRPVSSSPAPNVALCRLVEASGASKKSLAFRLNQLAETAGLETHYTHTSWTNWMKRGTRPVQPVRPLIAQVLEERLGRPVSLAEIDLHHDSGADSSVGLEFPRELGTAVQVATRFWSQVDRRDVRRGPGVAVANYNTPVRRWLGLPVDDTAASRSPGAFRRVGKADVVELLETAEQARQWDSRYGGGNWRTSQLTVCLKERAAPLLHGSYSDSVGRRLFTATAQLARLAGWTAFDNGDHVNAQRHYIQALRLTRAAGNVPLGGYVLTCMALQCSLGGFHDDAIDMVDSAFHRVGGHATPRMKGFFKLIEARIWARSGNARMADSAFATAEHLLDTANSRTGDDPAWIDFFDEYRLASDAIEIQRDLGRPRETQRWNALAAMPTDAFARAYTIRQSVLGSTCLQGYRPDLEQALDHADRAVSTLAIVSSARAVDYLNALISRMSRWRTEPEVAELTQRAKREIYATKA